MTEGGEVQYFYYMGNGIEETIGQIIKKNNQLITDESFYYQASGKDTINQGSQYSIEISTFTSGIRNYISSAVFGDFNSRFEISDSTKFVFLNSLDNTIKYSFNVEGQGHQFIVGLLNVKNLRENDELVDRDFIIYKDFYVIN